MPDWIEQVFDKNFVCSSNYAQLLADEVPKRYLVESISELFKRRFEGDPQNIALVMSALVDKLSETKRREYMTLVSSQLRTISDESQLIFTLRAIPKELWSLVDKVPKVRIENILIQNLKSGRADYHPKTLKLRCLGGALATWGQKYWPSFTLQDELVQAMLHCLSIDVSSRRYIQEYLIYSAIDLLYNTDEFKSRRWYFCYHIRESIANDECVFDELIKNERLKPLFRGELMAQLESIRNRKSNDVYWIKVYPYTNEALEQEKMLLQDAESLSQEFGTLDDSCRVNFYVEWDNSQAPPQDAFDLDIEKWLEAMAHIYESLSEQQDSSADDFLC